MNPLDKIILAFIFIWILKEMDIFFPIQIWVLGFYSKFQKDKEEVIEFNKILEESE